LLAAFCVFQVACGDDRSDPGTDADLPDELSIDAINDRADASVATSGTFADPRTATLTWDAVSHPDLRGYRVYFGPISAEYLQLRGQGIDTGKVTTHAIEGLASGRRYYFAVTAVDRSNTESDFSDEVFKDIP
jgi:fibronectin type 3 domain-containing protein